MNVEKVIKGFEKEAAARSEMLGGALTSPASAVGGIIGTLKGPYSEKQQREVNKKSWSNLIPGVGGYRLARRMSGIGLEKDERPKDKKDLRISKMSPIEKLTKIAKDHYHIDSEGKKTSLSDHKGKGEEAPHDHKLKDGGRTDMRESGVPHKHKEPSGEMTGGVVMSKSAFVRGFEKKALHIGDLAVVGGLTAAGVGAKKLWNSRKKQPAQSVQKV